MTRTKTTIAVLGLLAFAGEAAAQSGPYQFYPLSPCRVVNTRRTEAPALPALAERTFTIKEGNESGSDPLKPCGVPTDAKAVALNVTIAQLPAPAVPTAGYVTLWPADLATRPTVSTINFAATDGALANGAVVPLGATTPDIKAFFGGAAGNIHLLLDVTGYFR